MDKNPEILSLELNNNVNGHPMNFGHLLCHSACMQTILGMINQVALSDVTVLITGETGTGKELVARTIYARSLRRNTPFIKLNCAALPGGLLESELFGYEKGAFTGAIQRKLGKFEYADKGTIFLDEIGEVSLHLQAKLSQVLQDGTFTHLGGNTDIKVNVQVIAATNKDLRAAVDEGKFREDLFYRLNVVNIAIPPLRERTGEIPFLVDFFLKKYNNQFHRNYPLFSSDLMKKFMKYEWPGNIRELENLVKQIILLEDERFGWSQLSSSKPKEKQPVIQTIPSDVNGSQTEAGSRFSLGKKEMPSLRIRDVKRKAVKEAEKALILLALQQTHWNRKKAALILKTSYKSLLSKIIRYNLEV